MNRIILTKKCLQCEKIIYKPINESLKCWITRHKFCSVSCMDIFRKGKPFKHSKQFKKGHIPANKGKKDPISAERMRLNNPMKRLEVKLKSSDSHRGKNMGELHHNWKGGVSRESDKIRHSIEGNLWRQSIFARDNFTDQKTGIRGGDLVAHHILNFSSHPELRFALDNGITFSKKSHDEFHKIYGKKNNTKEQLLEFLNS